MEKARFTPGPWAVAFGKSKDEMFVVDATGAGLWCNDSSISNQADGPLLAAAPELLEALKGCVSELRQWMAHYGSDPSTNEKITAARAAIQKATTPAYFEEFAA